LTASTCCCCSGGVSISSTNSTVLRLTNNGVFEATIDIAMAGGDTVTTADGSGRFCLDEDITSLPLL
jgi:hypothetical protein